MLPIVLFLSAAWACSASAAIVTIPASGPCTVRIDGTINAGDHARLLELRDEFVIVHPESTAQSLACLDSPGGNFYEGLKIAELLFEEGVGTRVENGDICYSVCAIMFMMGRAKGDEVAFINRTLHVGGSLGFHRPYLTLDDAQSYGSGDINQAFDMGIEGILNLMHLASQPEPWGAEQMMPADLIQVMLATPPETMHVITMVEEAVRWSIEIDGNYPVTAPDAANLFFACENALSAAVRRVSEFYDDGFMTDDIFAFAPLPSYALEEAMRSQVAAELTGFHLTVGNLRSGYVGAGCRVQPREQSVGVCGIDQTTDVFVGNCDQGDLRFWDQLIYHHPRTQITTLGLEGAQVAHASRFARCRIYQDNKVTDDETCLHLVGLRSAEDGIWIQHILVWPSGARTVVEIRGELYNQPSAGLVNGEVALFSMEPEPRACVRNSVSRNVLCVSPLL